MSDYDSLLAGHDEEPPVNADGFDGLIVMGGPMNARAYGAYPWRSSHQANRMSRSWRNGSRGC
ncbi:MAG: hypothetical protein ABSE59_05710 [Opitutaceae bacterium]|jgi:GMP synthase-like glutamine amidotransferase